MTYLMMFYFCFALNDITSSFTLTVSFDYQLPAFRSSSVVLNARRIFYGLLKYFKGNIVFVLKSVTSGTRVNWYKNQCASGSQINISRLRQRN